MQLCKNIKWQNMEVENLEQILERRKEIEQELVAMLKETESDFNLDHVREAIYNEEDNDDMMKVVAMFDPSSRTQSVHYGAGRGACPPICPPKPCRR